MHACEQVASVFQSPAALWHMWAMCVYTVCSMTGLADTLQLLVCVIERQALALCPRPAVRAEARRCG